MNTPVLDRRGRQDIRAQVEALRESYTPEWQSGSPEEDPGAALAELFGTMFHQTVDRLNALPVRWYAEFLELTGFREPGPAPAWGILRFTPHDTLTEAVNVPAGTQVFTPDAQGENLVYETERTIQAVSARLLDVWFADGAADSIRRLDPSRPMRLFAPEGEEIQRHRFVLSHNQVLRLSGPCTVTLAFRPGGRYSEEDAARMLADLNWTWNHGGARLPFDAVRVESGRLVLVKESRLSLDPDDGGRFTVACTGTPPAELILDQAALSSAPLAPVPPDGLFSDDLPILPGEGGYCFGRRPAPYALFYLRCDTVLSKSGAAAKLRLDLSVMAEDPPPQPPAYDYTRPVIDQRAAVVRKPDDVFISGVLWEYYNGNGWRRLDVSGDRNPFAGRREGAFELTFTVPEDLRPLAVNAEEGLYLRARVTDMENQFSTYQRWIVPFLRSASLEWQYAEPLPARYAAAENGGERREIPGAAGVDRWNLTALRPMVPGKCLYLRFDRSPHAYPLSLRFRMEGRTRLPDQLLWERWNGRAFERVRLIDGTENLLHSGQVYLYLPEAVPECALFGVSGYWLRLCRTSEQDGPSPAAAEIVTNAVGAVQRQERPEQVFDTGVYEAEKELRLLNTPVQTCEVWVEERQGLTNREAGELERTLGASVRLEREGSRITRCLVRWEPVRALALAGPEDRCYELDPWEGRIRFGDGHHGKVPPAGTGNIRVRYTTGGGARGNVPPGTVNAPLTGLPLIAQTVNLTAMSGGTDRLPWRDFSERGSRRQRTRGRAVGRRDYEDLILQAFPQVRHVRCFPRQDERGNPAPGYVTVVFAGHGEPGESGEVLSDRIYTYLSERCSCCLTAEGHLCVRSAAVLTVHTDITIEPEEADLAAETQREIARRLRDLIENVWKSRPIGEQIRLDEIWSTVRETPNVRIIRRILAEAAFDREGTAVLVPLERDDGFPYAAAESGTHTVRLG